MVKRSPLEQLAQAEYGRPEQTRFHSRADASVTRRNNYFDFLTFKGTWKFEAFSPVRFLRPGLFQEALEAVGIGPVDLINKDSLHRRTARFLLNGIRQLNADLYKKIDGIWLPPVRLFVDTNTNRVVNVGLNDILEEYFNGSTYTALHYVGLTDGTPTTAAGDIMSDHSGWVEVTAYSESVRQTYNPDAAASQSIDNSTNKAEFSINGTTTVGGGFLATSATKGESVSDLISVEAFTGGDKSLGSGDTLTVQTTYTASDA